MPARPRISPPVGKSGPGTIAISSSMLMSGWSISASDGVDHFAEIMRRDIGRHADGDAARAIDEEVRKTRRKDDRLAFAAVVVRLEIDGVLVDVFEQR